MEAGLSAFDIAGPQRMLDGREIFPSVLNVLRPHYGDEKVDALLVAYKEKMDWKRLTTAIQKYDSDVVGAVLEEKVVDVRQLYQLPGKGQMSLLHLCACKCLSMLNFYSVSVAETRGYDVMRLMLESGRFDGMIKDGLTERHENIAAGTDAFGIVQHACRPDVVELFRPYYGDEEVNVALKCIRVSCVQCSLFLLLLC
jgi:hypothetical protein